jgi:hypothetical protein
MPNTPNDREHLPGLFQHPARPSSVRGDAVPNRTDGITAAGRPPRRRSGGFWPLLVLLALGGIGIRMIDVKLAQWNVKAAQDDSTYYYFQAHFLSSQGRWFIDPFAFGYSLGAHPSAAHPPLFALLLVAADKVRISGLNATRLFCCAIGGVGVFTVGLLGRQVAGRRAGLFAAAIAAIYPVWWLTDGLRLAEVVYLPLVAGLLLLSYRLWKRPRVLTAVGIG